MPTAGGAAIPLYIGAPFNKPVDLVLSSDNQTIFVADSSSGGTGRILSLSINGSTPVEVPGTAGTAPVALDLMLRSGQDRIYFCGKNAADAQKAVFEMVSTGATSPTIRFKGAPLSGPAGIVSTMDGTLFIADRVGTVFKLSGASVTQVASGLTIGTPPGVALSPDDKTLLISAKSSPGGTSQLSVMDIASGSMSVFNTVIGANSGAGGVHAARHANGATGVYAWVSTPMSPIYKVWKKSSGGN